MGKQLREIPRVGYDGKIDPKDLEAWMRDVFEKFSGSNNFVNNTLLAGTGITLTFAPATGYLTIAVKPSSASANASASSVQVTTADADSTYGSAEAALINELKSDVNSLVIDLNAVVTSLNDLKAKLRSAGILSN